MANANNVNDLTVIREVTPHITTLSVPFSLLGQVKVGGRATIVRLENNVLAVFCPVPLSPMVRKRIDLLGKVQYIVALNIEHHLYISSWAKAFPSASVIGMEGLPQKREKSATTKGTQFAHVVTKQQHKSSVSAEFNSAFEWEYLHAHQNKELVFLHKKSGTLIEADLIWNLPATEQYSKSTEDPTSGVLTKCAGGILNTRGDMVWQKRNLWYVAGAKDREAFAVSVKKIHGWNFDRIIPCHGDVIELGGKAVYDRLTEWFRDGKP